MQGNWISRQQANAQAMLVFLQRLEQPVKLLGYRSKLKRPLKEAAQALRQRRGELDYLPHHTEGDAGSEVIGYFNSAALLSVYYGEIRQAIRLCQGALRVCQTQIVGGFGDNWARYMFEPYLNIGRAEALMGHSDICIEHCDRIMKCILGKRRLRIGRMLVGIRDHCARAESTALTAYAVESIKALLIVQDFVRLRTLLNSLDEQARTAAAGLQRLFFESNIKCYIGMGEWDRADALLKSLETFGSGTDRHAALVLRCDLAISAVAIETAVATAADLSKSMQAEAGANDGRFEYFAYRCALIQSLCGCPGRAWEIAGVADRRAVALGDQILLIRIKSLLVLVAAELYTGAQIGRDELFRVIDELEAGLEQCCYRVDRAIGHYVLSLALVPTVANGSECRLRHHAFLATTAAATCDSYASQWFHHQERNIALVVDRPPCTSIAQSLRDPEVDDELRQAMGLAATPLSFPSRKGLCRTVLVSLPDLISGGPRD